ncbi:MAG TPA: ABC transporter ATP-binding protein [Sulfuricurvum sp.]|nr:ABC transporter ATP-binding protein [Sulfuricurvum sp.]
MLHVDNLSVQILKQVSFSLEKTQHLTILGNNGSGKTTLAKAICNLIHTNHVSIDGEKVSETAMAKRSERINFVPAKLSIYDEYLTVNDYLNLNRLTDRPFPENETILELLGLARLKENRCHTLSSGESALLLIAGSLIHGAGYTILDEPTANLDQAKKINVFQLLKNSPYLHTKIVITHDLNLAYKLGYNVLYLEEGTIRFFGTSEAFFAPDHLYTCFGDAVKNSEGNFVVNYDAVH